MPSRYDIPAQAQFINPYVPIPFDEIVQAGMHRQGVYDTNQNELAQRIAQAETLSAMPGADTEYLEGVIESLHGMAEEYSTQDYSSPEVIRELRKDFRSNVDAKRVADIQKSHEGWMNYLKEESQLKARGLYDPRLGVDYSDWNSAGGNIFQASPEARLDTERSIAEFFNSVGEEYLYEKDLGNGRGASMVGKSLNKLNKHVRDNAARIIDDPAVKQYLRINGYAPDDVDGLTNLLLAEAPKYVTSHPEGFYRQGNIGTEIPFTGESNTQSLPNTSRISTDSVKETIGVDPEKVEGVSDLLKNINVDNNQNIIPREIPEYESNSFQISRPGLEKEYQAALKAGKTDAKNKFEYFRVKQIIEADQEADRLKNLVDDIRQLSSGTIPDIDNMTELQVLNTYISAYNKSKNVDYNTYLYGTDKESTGSKAIINRQIIDDIGGRLLISGETGKGAGKPINTVEDLFKELDIPDKNRDIENLHITAVIPGLSMYKASIDAGNKGVKDFFISTNKYEQEAFSLIENATQLSLNGVIGDKLIKGSNYVVRTTVSLNSNTGQYEFVSNLRTNDGSNIVIGNIDTGKTQMSIIDLERYSVINLMQILQ